MSSNSPSSYNNNSPTSFTQSGSSSNSNQSPSAKRRRNELREEFRAQGMHPRTWQHGWYKQDQNRRRAKRASNLMKYPFERRRPLPNAKSLVSREIKGKFPSRFRIGNLAVRIRHPNGRKIFYTVSEFNAKYGNKWKSLPSGSRRFISENSTVQRKQVRVVKFVV